MAPKWPIMAREKRKQTPRWPQHGPNMVARGPGVALRWFEMASDCSKMAQTGPRNARHEPKAGPRWLQVGPKLARYLPKMAPELQKRCSRLGVVQILANWPFSFHLCFVFSYSSFSKPEKRSGWPQNGPSWPQECQNTLPGGRNMAPRFRKRVRSSDEMVQNGFRLFQDGFKWPQECPHPRFPSCVPQVSVDVDVM